MQNFPKAPPLSAGKVVHYNIAGNCSLCVPLALCATQKAEEDLRQEILEYVQNQAMELDPRTKPEYLKQELIELEKRFIRQKTELEITSKLHQAKMVEFAILIGKKSK